MPSANAHIILIDGKSGVGKSRLAAHMAGSLGATLVELDEVYPGWGGLAAGRDAVIAEVIRPFRDGTDGSYVSWDWGRNAPHKRILVPWTDVLIVDGCGVSTPESRALADVVVWVDCDEDVRQSRLFLRDGTDFDEHVPNWERQVDAHIRDNDPIASATVRVRT